MKKQIGYGLTALALVASFGLGAATSSPTVFAGGTEITAVSMLRDAQFAVARSKAELIQVESSLEKALAAINGSGGSKSETPIRSTDPDGLCCHNDD